MSELKNCYHCGKLFLSVGERKLCPECEALYRGYYKEIETYLSGNNAATLDEIMENTNVPEKAIRLFLKGGSLIPGKPAIEYKRCIICGAKILKGRMCEKCKKKMLS